MLLSAYLLVSAFCICSFNFLTCGHLFCFLLHRKGFLTRLLSLFLSLSVCVYYQTACSFVPLPNLKLFTYCCIAWWGASEAVWLSSIRRNFSSTDAVGRVSNIRYVNITSRAEGGNLISSRTAYPLENLFFENVVLNIDEWQPRRPSLNYTPPSHDYRPVIGTPAVVPFATNGFYFEHVLNATLQNCSVVFGQPKQQSWGKCLNGTQMSHVTRDNFHCIHQS